MTVNDRKKPGLAVFAGKTSSPGSGRPICQKSSLPPVHPKRAPAGLIQRTQRPAGNAPPVYCPRPSPELQSFPLTAPVSAAFTQVQSKTSVMENGRWRAGAAPPVYRSVASVRQAPALQTKPVPKFGTTQPPPVFSVPRAPAPRPHGGRNVQLKTQGPNGGRFPFASTRPVVIQRAKRTGFFPETLKAVDIDPGEHRRHIIPNSLMKDAINNWNAVHNAWSKITCQEWLDRLNNHLPNLIPGEGVANMASGGIMHQGHKLESKISGMTDMTAIASAAVSEYPKVTAFGGTSLARELVDDVVDTVSSFTTSEAMKEFVSDMGHSGGFDWPTPDDSSSGLFGVWLSVYNGFVYMRDHPGSVSQEGALGLFIRFLTLPAPTDHH